MEVKFETCQIRFACRHRASGCDTPVSYVEVATVWDYEFKCDEYDGSINEIAAVSQGVVDGCKHACGIAVSEMTRMVAMEGDEIPRDLPFIRAVRADLKFPNGRVREDEDLMVVPEIKGYDREVGMLIAWPCQDYDPVFELHLVKGRSPEDVRRMGKVADWWNAEVSPENLRRVGKLAYERNREALAELANY